MNRCLTAAEVAELADLVEDLTFRTELVGPRSGCGQRTEGNDARLEGARRSAKAAPDLITGAVK